MNWVDSGSGWTKEIWLCGKNNWEEQRIWDGVVKRSWWNHCQCKEGDVANGRCPPLNKRTRINTPTTRHTNTQIETRKRGRRDSQTPTAVWRGGNCYAYQSVTLWVWNSTARRRLQWSADKESGGELCGILSVSVVNICTECLQTASAYAALRPLDPLPGLRLWTPLGGLPSPDPLAYSPNMKISSDSTGYIS